MATLKDVAKHANVSVSTVSRVLSGAENVHPETIKAVLAAVAEVSYTPNRIIKEIHQGKRHSIAVVVPTINYSIFAEIIEELEAVTRSHGYNIVVYYTFDNPINELDCLQLIMKSPIDGVIIAGTGKNNKVVQQLNSMIPVVQLIRTYDSNISSVAVDYAECTQSAISYLARRNCSNILFVNGPKEIPPYQTRYKAYVSAAKKLHLKENIIEVESRSLSMDWFFDTVKKLNRVFTESPSIDGVLCATAIQSLAVLKACNDLNIKIPDSTFLMCLSGNSLLQMSTITVSDYEVPKKQLASLSADLMIRLIKTPREERSCFCSHILVKAPLVERESTKRCQ